MSKIYVDEIAGIASADTVAIPGHVIQVVQTVKTGAETLTLNTAWSDIADLSQAITPSSSTNKILLTVHVCVGKQNGVDPSYPKIRLQKNGSNIAVGTAGGNRQAATAMWNPQTDAVNSAGVMSMTWLDTAGTTDSITYKVQAFGSQNRAYSINLTGTDENTAGGSAVSTLTLMEIAG